MFDRGSKETQKLLREILAELRKLNRAWEPKPEPEPLTPEPEPEAAKIVPILKRHLGRSKDVLLGDSLMQQLSNQGYSLDSLAPTYRSFTRHEIEEALALLIDGGKVCTSLSQTSVQGVSARRVIYKAVVA